MPLITFLSSTGDAMSVEGANGQSLMEVAKRHGVDGIVGECGGSCACATCHVLIDACWWDTVGEPSPGEADMLDFALARGPTSRLSCQIRIRPALHGLIVRVPERQAG